MKIPFGRLDTQGKTAKGEIILTVGEDQVALKEFGATTEGNKTSCYVLTACGDIPTLRFVLNANIADHADLIVDGVLRNSQSAALTKTFKGTFEKVLYQGRKSASKRGAVKYSKMEVKELVSVPGWVSTSSSDHSAVGSLELRLYRTGDETIDEREASQTESLAANSVDRPPAYDRCAEWFDCNSNINCEGPQPPFQIGFFDHKEASKTMKDRVLTDLPNNCKLWAIFVFKLRAAGDLHRLGFDGQTSISDISSMSPSSPLSTDWNTLAESKGIKAENSKRDPENLSTGIAVVEDTLANTTRESSESVRNQGTDSSSSPALILAPQKTQIPTSKSVVKGIPGLPVEQSHSVSDSLEDLSARRSLNPTTERPNLKGITALGFRYYSSQGIGFVESGAGLEKVPVTDRPGRFSLANTSKNDAQSTEGPENECNTPQKSQERGLGLLPGVTGVGISPAHKAYLARRATEEPESRDSSPTPINDGICNIGRESSAFGLQTFADMPASIRGLSQPPEPLVPMEGRKLNICDSHDQVQAPIWKPMTPQAASMKRAVRAFQNQTSDLHNTWAHVNLSNSLSTHHSQDSCMAVNLSLPSTLKPESPHDHNSARRATSEAPSETETEVAPAEDIERMVKSCQRSTQKSDVSYGSTHSMPVKEPSFMSDMTEDEQGNHTHPSPVLGSLVFSYPRSGLGGSLSSSFIANTEILLPPGSPAQHKEENSSARPITPGSLSSAQGLPQTPKDFTFTPVRNQSVSRTPMRLKRKVDAIAGNALPDSASPRKCSIAPADRNQKFEHDKAAAEARIAAAERKREELQKRLEVARELKREMEKVQELHKIAANFERENAEMEAEIAAIYGTNNLAQG